MNEDMEYFCKVKLFNPNMNIKASDLINEFKPLDKNNLRILHGTMEIANQMHTLTEGLKKIGINAQALNYYPNYLGYESQYTLDINAFKNVNEANVEAKRLAAKMMAENDIFHLYFGTSLTLDYSDLPLMKELGKKVIMQYFGSEVRMYSKASKLSKYVRVKNMDEDAIKRRLEFMSRYISDCLVDYELAEYVKEYHSNLHYIKMAVDLNNYRFIKETNNSRLLIVHAPTAPEIKGTEYVLKAIEELKDIYSFDFKLIQGMSHKDAVRIYEKADLVIDQLLIGSHGVFSVEAMAMGKPVICFISDFMREKYPKELPIISANPDNIKEVLQYAIKNKDMLNEIGANGRRYVEKYHDRDKICKELNDIYKCL